MPTYTGKSLADGQVAIAQTAIYTVPAATIAFVKQIRFFNTNAVTQLVEIWIKRSGGTARKQAQFQLDQNEAADYLEEGGTLELSAGDAILAKTGTAAAVDYMVLGVEEA